MNFKLINSIVFTTAGFACASWLMAKAVQAWIAAWRLGSKNEQNKE